MKNRRIGSFVLKRDLGKYDVFFLFRKTDFWSFLIKKKTYLVFCLIFLVAAQMYFIMPSLMGEDYSRQAKLRGWTRTASRNVSDYILPQENTVLLEPHKICQKGEKFFLLIFVCSSLENFAVRRNIRKTWGNTKVFNYEMFAKLHAHLKGKYLEASENRIKYYADYLNLKENETSIQNTNIPVRIVFVVGRTKKLKTLRMLRIRVEFDRYQDILQENFVDTYNNLTLKSLFALKWVKRRCLNNCAFVMKSDDDTFVNIPNLLHFLLGGTIPLYDDTANMYDIQNSRVLSEENRLKKTHNYLVGCRFCGYKPVYVPWNKWYMPFYMYPYKTYPNYLSGHSYVMSIDVVNKIYEAALFTQLIHLEDIYLTGLCADKAALQSTNFPLFQPLELRYSCARKIVITQHTKELQETYTLVTDLSKPCKPSKIPYAHSLQVGNCFVYVRENDNRYYKEKPFN